MTTDGGRPDPGRAAPDLVLGPRIRWDRTVSDQGGVPHLQAVCEADLS